VFVFATNCINITLVQNFWNKNVSLPIFWNVTNLLQWSIKVLILGHLYELQSSGSKVWRLGDLKYTFKTKEFVLLNFWKKKFFTYQRNWGCTKNLGILPLKPLLRTMDLPEIKVIINGALPWNVTHGYGPAWKKYIVLYVKCYVKQCCTELNKPKAIRLYSHLNYLLL